jgi:uncharacterized protein (TIGR00297 family)
LQSRALVLVIAPLLLFGAAYPPVHTAILGQPLTPWIAPLLLSLGFAVLVFMLRAATLPASILGFLICLMLTRPARTPGHNALAALIVLFVLTFLATRFGRSKKEARNLAEKRTGRRASQIAANLAVAAIFAALGWYSACIAALAEAAADTVSSEIGQAVGGPARMVTTWRRVAPGTNGGISVVGTIGGVGAAAVVVAVGALHHALWPDAALVFAAACGGLFFDSVLGATLERRGWLGNDLVNFCSTLFAAAIVLIWLLARNEIPTG